MRMQLILALVAWTAVACNATLAYAQLLQSVGEVALNGEMPHADDLSGIAVIKDKLFLCPDEGTSFYVLSKEDDDAYLLDRTEALADDEDAELELEGAASDGKFLYLVGSHCLRRKSVDESLTYEENRKRLSKVGPHDDSYRLFRLKVDDEGLIKGKKEISLRDLLKSDAGAAPFFDVPSKENGIEIEGMAISDGRLYVGFRGPVLRGGFVPVAAFQFKEPEAYELRFVRIGGRGIRDITAVDDGFLIIAGPVGDGDGEFQLWHWKGADCVPGTGSPGGAVEMLGRIPSSRGVSPEGVAVASETSDEWQILIVSDGNDIVQKFVVPRPRL
jgi:hypothetical protein